MANLNLSQFTEKTFVADADWAFVWDTDGAISKKVSRNNLLNSGTLTTSAPVTISQTWNDAAVAFTALKVDATSTNSASTSLLLDLQVGGVSKFSVRKDGSPTPGTQFIGYRLNGYANYAVAQVAGFTGINNPASGVVVFPDALFATGAGQVLLNGAGVSVGSGSAYAFKSTPGADAGTADTILLRDGAANTLALRNGANAQTFNVYGTYSTSPSLAYSRLAIACDTSGNATLTTQSTGVAGTISINGVPVGRGKTGIATNLAIGPGVLQAQIGGGSIVGIGDLALYSSTSGNWNTAVGSAASYSNTTGGSNSTFGLSALQSNSTGSNNVAIGKFAGYFNTSGTNNITNDSIYIGADSKSSATNQTNQIVIGYNATGIGSNSVVLGNDSITKTALKGNVGIGTTAPSSNLTVAQSTAGVGSISVGAAGTTITGVGTQFLNTFAVGQTITSAGQTLTISAIASDTSMTISPAAGAAISGQAYTLVGGTRFTVAGHGDIEVNTAEKGLSLKSPDGTRYRITIPNGGASLTITAV